MATNVFTIPLWVVGPYSYLFTRSGARYRMVGWMFVIAFAEFLILQGRSYYSPAHLMLVAAGAVTREQWLASRTARMAHFVQEYSDHWRLAQLSAAR